MPILGRSRNPKVLLLNVRRQHGMVRLERLDRVAARRARHPHPAYLARGLTFGAVKG